MIFTKLNKEFIKCKWFFESIDELFQKIQEKKYNTYIALAATESGIWYNGVWIKVKNENIWLFISVQKENKYKVVITSKEDLSNGKLKFDYKKSYSLPPNFKKEAGIYMESVEISKIDNDESWKSFINEIQTKYEIAQSLS